MDHSAPSPSASTSNAGGIIAAAINPVVNPSQRLPPRKSNRRAESWRKPMADPKPTARVPWHGEAAKKVYHDELEAPGDKAVERDCRRDQGNDAPAARQFRRAKALEIRYRRVALYRLGSRQSEEVKRRADEQHHSAIENECAAPADSRFADGCDWPCDRRCKRHGEHLCADCPAGTLPRYLRQKHLSRSRKCRRSGQTQDGPG
ncbi:hypothetical protein ACVI1N_000466 [Sinorhizobium medicae]